MPSRRRHKSPPPPPSPVASGGAGAAGDAARVQSDVERFAAALKESERADAAARERARQAKAEATRAADAKAAQAASLATARRDLERAVEAVRAAKQSGRGRAEADAAWKVAKARVIELETGTAPTWAPKPPPGVSAEGAEGADGPEGMDGLDGLDDTAGTDDMAGTDGSDVGATS